MQISRLSLSDISCHRTELMGLSAICIIMCHSYANGVSMPGWLGQIFSLGQLGVNVFFFLSGLSIWYSLKKNGGGILYWYIKRYKRLFVPFLLLGIPFFGIMTVINGYGIVWFLMRITTLEFWFSGGGAWFVSVLVALYLITPWWEIILRKTGLRSILSLCIFFMILLWGYKYMDHSSEICFYFLGYWIAPYVKSGKMVNGVMIIVISLALYLLLRFTPSLQSFSRSVFLVPLFIILPCFVFNRQGMIRAKRVFSFMGTISLESYLLNVFLPFFFIQPLWIQNNTVLGYGNYLGYLMVVVVGITLSVVVHKLSINFFSVNK